MDEFAQVLRAWRDRVTPEQAGLAPGLGRRTPGLRREELALLAGVSVDYVVRLEQGRARNPSPQVLAALARGLRLDDDERDHFFRVAGAAVPGRGLLPSHVTPSVRRIVDRLADLPVAVFTPIHDLLLWNPMWAALLGDPSVRTGLDRNLIWQYFAGPPMPVTHSPAEEESFARSLVGHLRLALGQYPGDPHVGDLVDRLLEASPEFARRWNGAPVGEFQTSHKIIHTQQVGDIVLDCDTLTGGTGGLLIVVMTAAPGTQDERKLDLLRVVGLQGAWE
ncbi:helix-turn-helix domain-containing protein [Kineosporia sp. J2-2]|uniref:Helix-turn-helix domain-containing protein n=1 Tax=Kineosporia corallincola TaxID=2835133 RepID=A0ABS5TPA2_9ACTN|nr:helix-turn-helix transcriptional regulator [Kineosporia corallincola]MBT0772942.1 helix-turn-helix domain-containing protein [Kineosporia corallincola]